MSLDLKGYAMFRCIWRGRVSQHLHKVGVVATKKLFQPRNDKSVWLSALRIAKILAPMEMS